MALDEALAARVRRLLPEGAAEKAMLGGVAWALRGSLLCGVVEDGLVARVGPGNTASALAEPHTRPFTVNGMPMKGFVLVGPEGFREDGDLASWMARAVQSSNRLSNPP